MKWLGLVFREACSLRTNEDLLSRDPTLANSFANRPLIFIVLSRIDESETGINTSDLMTMCETDLPVAYLDRLKARRVDIFD